MGSRNHVRFAIAAALVGVAIVGSSAYAASGVGEVDIATYYGQTCHKQYGSTNCVSDRIDGVRVTVTTYPALKRLASGTSRGGGEVDFRNQLPFNLAFFFNARVRGRAYKGAWRMTNLQSLSGQIVPVAILLCPSGAWIATLVSVADSCAQRGNGVLAYGAARGSA